MLQPPYKQFQSSSTEGYVLTRARTFPIFFDKSQIWQIFHSTLSIVCIPNLIYMNECARFRFASRRWAGRKTTSSIRWWRRQQAWKVARRTGNEKSRNVTLLFDWIPTINFLRPPRIPPFLFSCQFSILKAPDKIMEI